MWITRRRVSMAERKGGTCLFLKGEKLFDEVIGPLSLESFSSHSGEGRVDHHFD